MKTRFLLVVVGLSLLVGACAVLSPEGKIPENDSLSAVIYKDPT
jgi:hypothetical protein